MTPDLCKLATDAYIHMQELSIRTCIENVCDKAGLSYEQITSPKCERSHAALNSLVCALGNMGLPLSRIEKLSKLHYAQAQKILEERRRFGQRVRTQRWM